MKYKILFIILFFSTLLEGQNIKGFLSYINYLDQENQVISYDFIRKSGPVGLADVILGNGLVQRKNNDTLGAFHNILINYEDGTSGQQIYDGKNVVRVMLTESQCLVINLDSFAFAYNLITGNIVNSLRPKFLYTEDYFSSVVDNDDIEELKIDTVQMFGQSCYELKIKYKDSDDMKDNYTYHYFDAKLFYPIGNRSFFEYAGTKLEQSFIISNIISSKMNHDQLFNYKVYEDFGFKIIDPNSMIPKKEEVIKEKTDITQFNLENYKGELVIVDFWYIGCGPCFKLIPTLEKLHEEYSNVNFIGLNPYNDTEKIEKFKKSRKMKYPVFYTPGLEKEYNVKSFPVVIIFDIEGNIIKRFTGYSDDLYDKTKEIIEENLIHN